jgi:hypothetical protein
MDSCHGEGIPITPWSKGLLSGVYFFRSIWLRKHLVDAQHKPLLVEIIAYAPTAFYHCTHCEIAWREMGAADNIHKEQMESSLPDELMQDYQTVSDWVRDLFREHCDRIILKVIDAASLEGFYRSLKYNAHCYPAVIINGRARFMGIQTLSSASEEIARLLASRSMGEKVLP